MSAQQLIIEHIDLWTSAVKTKNIQGRGISKKQELYGIKKLRELILELAVRGMLIPQDPNDEPASELLKRISAEKEQLVKDNKIKKPRNIPDIKDNEKNGILPSGWVFVRLNDLGEWGAGATPRRGVSELYGGNIPWFKSGELVGDYISESEETVTELALKKASLRLNKAGDVLLAMYGATIGKTSILSVSATTNQAVCACTPFSGFSNIFLLTLLKAYKPRFIGMGAGGAQPNISREKIITTVIALPPEAEQLRIVTKADELMALCDHMEKQTAARLSAHNLLVDTLLSTIIDARDTIELSDDWARLADHFSALITTDYAVEQLKKAIFHLAVQGKLVAQSPNDEPASQLMLRVQDFLSGDHHRGKLEFLKRDKSVHPPEDFHHSNPDGWVWRELQEIALFVNGKAHEQYVSEEEKFVLVNSKFVSNSGNIRKYVTERLTPLEAGDIALVMSDVPNGRALARTYLVEEDAIYTLNQRIGGLITSPEFNKQYLTIALNRHEYMLNYNDGRKQSNLKKVQVMSTPIPVPPLEEQNRIVAKIEELVTICDQLKVLLNDAQTNQLHLTDAVVENALAV